MEVLGPNRNAGNETPHSEDNLSLQDPFSPAFQLGIGMEKDRESSQLNEKSYISDLTETFPSQPILEKVRRK